LLKYKLKIWEKITGLKRSFELKIQKSALGAQGFALSKSGG